MDLNDLVEVPEEVRNAIETKFRGTLPEDQNIPPTDTLINDYDTKHLPPSPDLPEISNTLRGT